MDVTNHDSAIVKVVGLVAPLFAAPMLKTLKISSTADEISVGVLVSVGVSVRVFVGDGVTVRVPVEVGVTVLGSAGTGVNMEETGVRIGGVAEEPYTYL
jgi:hypothetical protein